MAAFSESICAFLVVIGLLTRPASVLITITMFVGVNFHISLGKGSPEMALLYGIIFLSIGLLNPGKYSLDHLIFKQDRLKAVRIHNHGDISVLKWESIPKPQLDKAGDDVLVRIIASSINHLDIWVRQGILGFPLPLILGSDGSGIVESCGHKVSEFHPGDEVIVQPMTFCGTCDHCLNGMENYCSEMGILGVNNERNPV